MPYDPTVDRIYYEPLFIPNLIKISKEEVNKQTDLLLQQIWQLLNDYKFLNQTDGFDLKRNPFLQSHSTKINETVDITAPYLLNESFDNQNNQYQNTSNKTEIFVPNTKIIDYFVTPNGDPCIKEIINLYPKILYRYTCEEKNVKEILKTTQKVDILQYIKELLKSIMQKISKRRNAESYST